MSATVTAIEVVPLQEDDPEARASYRVTVSAGGQDFHLFYTILEFPMSEPSETLTGLHSHSADVERTLVPRYFDYGGPHPLHRLVFGAYRGELPPMPVVISDRGIISASGGL